VTVTCLLQRQSQNSVRENRRPRFSFFHSSIVKKPTKTVSLKDIPSRNPLVSRHKPETKPACANLQGFLKNEGNRRQQRRRPRW
jgi:hypothetical protein